MMYNQSTIIALASAAGQGAISVIRLSGPQCIDWVDDCFMSINAKKSLKNVPTHTVHLGHLKNGEKLIDEVLVSIFKNPKSYTGEDVVEISCHGSTYIQQEIIQLFLRKGCRMAQAGEFTLRAFLNGKLDLSQAEAVADLIASENEASHQIAIQQMRGGFSNEISKLRQELLNFASLIELELDFSEEDVEFANRDEFQSLIERISLVLKRLIDSFAVGNVIKNGIPVAIVGEPNVGKSTLLNALLNEEKAIVSDIAGTTRDAIEDEITIGGIGFRFIDTAGIRDTKDTIESIGIQKTFEKIDSARIVIYLFDASKIMNTELSVQNLNIEIEKIKNKHPLKPLVVIANKVDQINTGDVSHLKSNITNLNKEKSVEFLPISAKTGEGIELLKAKLLNFINSGALKNNNTIVTNSRHYDALIKAFEAIELVHLGLQNQVSGDLLAIDIRQGLFHLGEITGEITTDDLLGNIFANFCIGK